MPGWKDGMVQRFLQQRMVRRWQGLAEASATVDLGTLRNWRAQARTMRRQLDRVIHQAEHRLALPVIGSNVIRKPMGTDWAWRPDLWRGALAEPGAVAATDRTPLGEGVALYHDCPLGEVVVRQVRNDKPEDRANLLAMTPHGWRASAERRAAVIEQAEPFVTTVSMRYDYFVLQ